MTFSGPANQVLRLCLSQSDRALLQMATERLPGGCSFEGPVWNLRNWDPRGRNISLKFDRYQNDELRAAVRFFICHKRDQKKIGALSAAGIWNELQVLDRCIGTKPLRSIAIEDFKAAEVTLVNEAGKSTARRAAAYLKDFGLWVSRTFGNQIDYRPSIVEHFSHGRNAADCDRERKLIPTECIEKIVRLADDSSLPLRDQYFLSALMLCVACGFRLSELATLPEECLVSTGPGTYGIKYFPKDSLASPVKPVPPPLNSAVQAIIEKLRSWTEAGREIAEKYHNNNTILDWRRIYADPDALEYFVRHLCSEWTANPDHRMVNPAAAWWNSRRVWIDVISILAEHGSQEAAAEAIGATRQTFCQLLEQQLASRDGELFLKTPRGTPRTDWTGDYRFLTFARIQKLSDRLLNPKQRRRMRPILEAAQECQLTQQEFTAERRDKEYEGKFLQTDAAVMSETSGDSIKVLLRASESLMVLPRYWHSEAFETSTTEYLMFSDTLFSLWMNGREKSRLTDKNPREWSFFERYDILDPRTNKSLRMSTHDVRHWLQTILEEGGASQEAIRLIMARNSVEHNAVYDQTSSVTRVNRIKADVRAKRSRGLVQENYNILFEERGEAEAEAYLDAKIGSMTNMTHGGCLLNMHTQSCQHNLGCFNASSGPCESLYVDPTDSQTSTELKKLLRENRVLRANIHPSSPQWTHADNVVRNITRLLEDDT